MSALVQLGVGVCWRCDGGGVVCVEGGRHMMRPSTASGTRTRPPRDATLAVGDVSPAGQGEGPTLDEALLDNVLYAEFVEPYGTLIDEAAICHSASEEAAMPGIIGEIVVDAARRRAAP